MDIKTQWQKIIDYCQIHGSITVRECFDVLHINSPTKRLSELRHNPNYIVDAKTVPVYDDDGNYRTRYSRYYIREVSK